MKKIIVYAGLTAMFALASCQKQELNDVTVPSVAGTKVTLHVQDNEWTDEEAVRSAYTPGTGVALSGAEKISLFYKESDSKVFAGVSADGSAAGTFPILATPEGGWVYSCTVPSFAASAPKWWSVMPYSRNLTSVASDGSYIGMRLGAVQFPAANSFDPSQDFLIGKPFSLESGAGSKEGTISAFRRMFMPLRVSVSGLEDSDVIVSATLSFSQAAAPASMAALVGDFQASATDVAASLTGMGTSAGANSVTAVYPSGLAKNGSVWPVWFIINPIAITGGDMTLTVSTGTATYTRTVSVGGGITFSGVKMNNIDFNVKGEGYAENASFSTPFVAGSFADGVNSLGASNGKSYDWTLSGAAAWTSAASDGGSGIGGAMEMDAASLTIPAVTGRKVTKAMVALHPCSTTSSSAVVKVKDGASELASYPAGQWASGGMIEITVPAGKKSLSGLTLEFGPSGQKILVSGVTLATEVNDYYELWDSGEDIMIGGVAYNKTNYPTARCLKLYEMANLDPLIVSASANGILFLDYDEADGKDDEITGTIGNFSSLGVVIIGRYPDHQPVVNSTYYKFAGDAVFKNIEFQATNASVLFQNNASKDISVVFEDCTLTGPGNFIQDYSANYDIVNLYVDNCVFDVPNYFFRIGENWKTNSTLRHKTIHVNNSVFYSSSKVDQYLICTAFKAKNGTVMCHPDLEITFTNNSVYNIGRNGNNSAGMIHLDYLKNVKIQHNAWHLDIGSYNANLLYIRTPASFNPTDSQVNGNFCINTESTGAKGWASCSVSAVSSKLTNSTASFNKYVKSSDGAASPFASFDTVNGYFPLTDEAKAYGAGATYDTKKWREW